MQRACRRSAPGVYGMCVRLDPGQHQQRKPRTPQQTVRADHVSSVSCCQLRATQQMRDFGPAWSMPMSLRWKQGSKIYTRQRRGYQVSPLAMDDADSHVKLAQARIANDPGSLAERRLTRHTMWTRIWRMVTVLDRRPESRRADSDRSGQELKADQCCHDVMRQCALHSNFPHWTAFSPRHTA